MTSSMSNRPCRTIAMPMAAITRVIAAVPASSQGPLSIGQMVSGRWSVRPATSRSTIITPAIETA